jgi:hypothetical protein
LHSCPRRDTYYLSALILSVVFYLHAAEMRKGV